MRYFDIEKGVEVSSAEFKKRLSAEIKKIQREDLWSEKREQEKKKKRR